MDLRPALAGDGEDVRAFQDGERMAEQQDIHAGFGELLDVGEAEGSSHVEACLLEDEAAGLNELQVSAKDKH